MGLTEARLQSGWGGGQGVGQRGKGPHKRGLTWWTMGSGLYRRLSVQERQRTRKQRPGQGCVGGMAKGVSREDGRLWSKNGRRE